MGRMRMGMLLTVVVAALATLTVGQNRPGQSGAGTRHAGQSRATLVGVHLVGSKRYTEEDIEAATGLKTGAVMGPEDFSAAADKLSSYGVFEEVRYEYKPAGTGYSLEFKVVDNPQFLPVLYDNFVWFTDKELTEAVRQRVPLFKGEVAQAGDMVDQVTDALQGLLVARGIEGQVRFIPESNLHGTVERGVFTIDGVKVRISEVKFTGASEADRALLEREGSKLVNTSYQLSIVRRFADFNLKPLYLARGYLKVAFAEPVVTVVGNDAREPGVAISIGVDAGPQYMLESVAWSGCKVLVAADLEQKMREKPGMVLDALELQKDMERLQQAYGAKGYLRATVTPNQTFNEPKRTVSYRMEVKEGNQYRLGSVDLDGLDKQTMARLREAWKLREGEPYDTEYEREYMKTIGPMLAQNISVDVSHEIDDEAKTVGVTMKFMVHANKVVR